MDLSYQQEEEPVVESVDLAGLDLSEEDVLEGARALDPVGARVEREPHPVKNATKDGGVVAEKT